MEFLRNNKPLVAGGAVIGVAILAYLALGVFGIQAAFIDDEVDQADPFAVQTADGGTEEDPGADEASADDESDDSSGDTGSGSDAGGESDEASPAADEPIVEASGSFIALDHAAVGDAIVLSNGEQRFLRFENFETDNGPDLFVYLVAGTSADGDEGLFDDDFVNLGRLAGNIGDQNYEVDVDLDLSRYNTVVIWCDRFNSAFTAADLA